MSRPVCVPEVDDYPRNPGTVIRVLDEWKREYPDFRATVFAIPAEMTPALWRPLLDRGDWLAVGVHSIRHSKRELERAWTEQDFGAELCKLLTAGSSYREVFKPLRYGWRRAMADCLAKWGWGMACRTAADLLDCYPSPAHLPAGIRAYRKFEHGVVSCYGHPDHTPFLDNGVVQQEWRLAIERSSGFATVEERLTPLRKIYLGAGSHAIPGFDLLDNRACAPGTVLWSFGDPLPYHDRQVACCLVQQSLMYAPRRDYLPVLREILRVLCCGGQLLVKEDDDRSRVWRPPGARHRTGVIRSTSNPPMMEALLAEAGFEVVRRTVQEHLGLHGQLLNRQNKLLRGWCYIAEGRRPAERLSRRQRMMLARQP